MKNRIRILLSVCTMAVMGSSAYAVDGLDRDPFSPFVLDIPTGVSEVPVVEEGANREEEYINPLERDSVYNYKVVGIMASSEKALAVVKTMDRQEFFVRLGDKLGREGGVVDVINTDGVSVVNEEEVVDIPVRNKVELQPNVHGGIGGGIVLEE